MYINLDPDYFTHPKTIKLVSKIGIGADSLPIKIWCYCSKYSPKDGIITMSAEALAITLNWSGNPKEMLEALKIDYLHATGMPDEYQVHDWKDHQGHIYALKIRNRKNAVSRWKNIKNTEKTPKTHTNKQVTTYATGMPVVCQSDAPNLTLPNQTKKPSNDHKIAIDYFCKSYELKTGSKYIFNSGKDGKIISNILKTINIDDFKNRVNSFFSTSDVFIKEAGYSIGVFQSQINKILPNKILVRKEMKPIGEYIP